MNKKVSRILDGLNIQTSGEQFEKLVEMKVNLGLESKEDAVWLIFLYWTRHSELWFDAALNYCSEHLDEMSALAEWAEEKERRKKEQVVIYDQAQTDAPA